MALEAHLFYGLVPKEPEDYGDELANNVIDAEIPGIDGISWGRDFFGSAIAVKESVVEAYYGPKRINGPLPVAAIGWDGMLVDALARLGLSADEFEPAGWYVSPSYA